MEVLPVPERPTSSVLVCCGAVSRISCWSSSIGSWKASAGFGSAAAVASPSMSCNKWSDAAYLHGLGLGWVGGKGVLKLSRPTGWWVQRAACHHLMT